MRTSTIFIAGIVSTMLAATAASAGDVVIITTPDGQNYYSTNSTSTPFAPYHPAYFDPYHRDHDYKYWEKRRAEELRRNPNVTHVYIHQDSENPQSWTPAR